MQTVQYGTVTGLRPVQIEGTKTPIGAGAGAIIGGIAGSSIGGGKGSYIGATAGAVAGGLAGSAAEEALTKTQGVEITVRMEGSNQTVAIVQEASPTDTFRIGERVRISSVNGQTRVSH
jgi:outer membrane lipoprotein SlyB